MIMQQMLLMRYSLMSVVHPSSHSQSLLASMLVRAVIDKYDIYHLTHLISVVTQYLNLKNTTVFN